MRHPLRSLLSALAAALAAVVIVAGPAAAAEPEPAAVLAVEEAPAEEAPEGEEVPEGEEGGEAGIEFPLDLDSPYGAFGAFLLVCLLIAIGLGIRNAIVQLRGERPQADGSWRAR